MWRGRKYPKYRQTRDKGQKSILGDRRPNCACPRAVYCTSRSQLPFRLKRLETARGRTTLACDSKGIRFERIWPLYVPIYDLVFCLYFTEIVPKVEFKKITGFVGLTKFFCVLQHSSANHLIDTSLTFSNFPSCHP